MSKQYTVKVLCDKCEEMLDEQVLAVCHVMPTSEVDGYPVFEDEVFGIAETKHNEVCDNDNTGFTIREETI
tara:strand:+ start:191 stop:403 length:213 start_codon:yes stop_codon:yes gene_type:complete